MSELFALKWKDIHFETGEISVIRSIVMQMVGRCKTEESQKPIPMDSSLAQALKVWQKQSEFTAPDDWVFASMKLRGRRPYWGQSLMRHTIRPPREGWHQQSDRLAHVPAFFLDSFAGNRS